MEEKILKVFKSHGEGFVSGQDLSDKLGVSRAAVWKHIGKLREWGYTVEAQPHLGYKLAGAPDRLLAHELSWKLGNKVIGKKILSYDVVDSTMDVALGLAEANISEGACVFSEGQKHGRGRVGRQWQSPKHKGIYFSCVLRPDIIPNESPKITLMAAVALARAIREETSTGAQIKWPNDILIGGKKVCGILTEMNAETDRVKFIILGVGVNANGIGKSLVRGATTLQEEIGHKVNRIGLAQSILKSLDEQYRLFIKKGFKEIIREWKELSATLGRHVKVKDRGRTIEGQAVDVDKDGALVIRRDHGFLERILAGDIEINSK